MIGRTSLVVAGVVLGCSAQAHACAGHGNNTGIAVLPGGGLVSEWAGPAMLLLAAFLKRPFVSLAGIDAMPLWRSIQATLLSSLATTAAGVVSLALVFAAGPVGALAIVATPFLGALVDWAWLGRPGMGARKRVSYGWLAAGNCVAALAIVSLPVWMAALRFDSGHHLWWARSTAPSVGMITTIGVLAMIVASFVRAPRDRNAPELYRAGRAFEVIMPGAASIGASIATPIDEAVMAIPQPMPRST